MSAGTLAEVLAEHRAILAPISHAWSCPCGAESTPYQRGDDYPTVHARRRTEWEAHLAAVIAAWLTEDAQVERAWRAIAQTGTPWRQRNVRDIARAALAAVTGEA